MDTLLRYAARMRYRLALVGALGAAAAALSAAVVPDAAPGARFTGAVHVVDGDTIDVGVTRVRLHAVDAPERDQTCETKTNKSWACGGWVSKAVADRYEGARADCERLDTDRYGRTVARCFVDREDIGAWLVREGLAFAYVRYGADYAALEHEAEAQDRGLHAVRMELPSVYRAGRRTDQPKGDCAIKGNISAGGERIYHRPEQAFYPKTRISAAKGERWFCSVQAAEAAGWRAARR